jgi:glycosyltransferase involved in cell wall biosynthesis
VSEINRNNVDSSAPAGRHDLPAISACIVCRNERDRLGPCLDSLGWADEVVVMDLESTDGSSELAAERGARVLRRPPVPYADMVREELFAEALGDWLLSIDPDERVTPGLARALRDLSRRRDIDGVMIPFTNCYFGYAPSDPWQRYEPHLRMFRRGTIHWPTQVHRQGELRSARIHHLPPDDSLVMMHDTWRTVPEVLDRFVRYVPADARSMLEAGTPFSAAAMCREIVTEVDKQFFRGRTWEDGVPGIVRASLLVVYRVLVWSMFWQLSGVGRIPGDDRLLSRAGAAAMAARRAVGFTAWGWRRIRSLVR